MTTKLPKGMWTAAEALSWGMFGDTTILSPARQFSRTPAPKQVRSYEAAVRDLRDAVAAGTVNWRGYRVLQSGISPFRKKPKRNYCADQPLLAIDAFGELTFTRPSAAKSAGASIPRFTGIVLDEVEVQALWPKPRPDLEQWMVSDAIAYPKKKRYIRIDDCIESNRCTNREANKAYEAISSELRRKRGERDRHRAQGK